MASPKVSIPKGTRDFTPVEMNRRNYIFDTIKSVFQLYGYSPIETPSMENLSTLMGKYGEEGDKLLFKILNSGNFLEGVDNHTEAKSDYKKMTPLISEKGLRYDLTVPFARFVVMHQNELTFPFKRYQMQPVWRADRPQKGRYREFYQCDADVIGSNSLLNETELMGIIDRVFDMLNIKTTIKLNNRKILTGIAEYIGEADKIVDITVAIDKLDKIGLDKVNEELIAKGLSQETVAKLQPIINLSGDTQSKLCQLEKIFTSSETGQKGIAEMREILDLLGYTEIKAVVEFDITLARGLNYYTGSILEVKADEVAMGSICGGGRYDNLTGIFGLPDMSGVGISFGADRIYDVLQELNRFPENTQTSTQVLFVNFGEKEMKYCLPLLAKLRKKGISAEMYPDPEKIKKQMSYANANNIPWVVVVGETEMLENKLTLKNMQGGTQEKISLQELTKSKVKTKK